MYHHGEAPFEKHVCLGSHCATTFFLPSDQCKTRLRRRLGNAEMLPEGLHHDCKLNRTWRTVTGNTNHKWLEHVKNVHFILFILPSKPSVK